jgi:GNAT superfamily N-acetyltransferase
VQSWRSPEARAAVSKRTISKCANRATCAKHAKHAKHAKCARHAKHGSAERALSAAIDAGDLEIVPFRADMTFGCEQVLRALPDWFGKPDANEEYIRELALFSTFALEREGTGVEGFINLREHAADSWEINCIALQPALHGRGIGRWLIEYAETWLRQRGVSLLHVKTLGPSSPDPFYARTRGFYRALGFRALFESAELWGPRTPCLVLVKLL